jgi:hypothetical protein
MREGANLRSVEQNQIQRALEDIRKEADPTTKNLKLASLCSAVFRENDIDLVVVGGSAIEFFTEGAYTSGDVGLCVASASRPLTVRRRQELMGKLLAKGGPRSWEVAGSYVDILGTFENLARTAIRKIAAPYGEVSLAPVEELLVERILVSRYPQEYKPARDCARKLAAAALNEEVEIDWSEVKRLAITSAYGNWADVKDLINEQAKALQIRGPYHSDE